MDLLISKYNVHCSLPLCLDFAYFQLSVFGGSAWKWNDLRQQFYLHQFHAGQPDLNYRNDLVRQEMKVCRLNN
jgi:glycosidase